METHLRLVNMRPHNSSCSDVELCSHHYMELIVTVIHLSFAENVLDDMLQHKIAMKFLVFDPSLALGI